MNHVSLSDLFRRIAIAGVAASLSVAAALRTVCANSLTNQLSHLTLAAQKKKYKVAGKVVLLGTPAEEASGGKLNLLEAGAYGPMEICTMLHPGE